MTRDDSLLAAIVADPENTAAYQVYADWLLERGDVWGELINIQIERERGSVDEALAARERELLAEHSAWTEHITVGLPIKLAWRRGFIDRAQIHAYYQSTDAAKTYATLAVAPIAAAIRTLVIGAEISHHGRGNGTEHDDISVLAAMRAAPLRAVRSLTFTAFDHDVSWTHVGELAAAGDALASVEELTIHTGRMRLGPVTLPRLRSLHLITGGLPAHVLVDLAAQTWPQLASLEIYFGTSEYGGSCSITETKPLLEGDVIPAVTELALCNGEFADELVECVARSKILPRLRRLDLSKGTLGSAGVRTLLRHADAFAHLESLDLGGNYLSADECRQVATICKSVELGHQKHEDEYGRYVSLGE
jgi:uncharacterized protein (TIGR02996 family)